MNVIISNNDDIELGILSNSPCEGKLGTTLTTKHLTLVAQV